MANTTSVNGVKVEKTEDLIDRQVWVGGVRFLQDYTIGNEPSEPGEELTIWKFFQDLVGEDPAKRIESIHTYPPETGVQCDCGAEPDPGGKL